jgi:MarR family transcriptional regulator, organic hydroperoxide resistance regulator
MPEFLDLHGKTGKALRALSEAAMRRHGLYEGQNYLLALLWQSDGATPGEVAEALRVATPTVVKMANRMESSGLIERRRDTGDNRLVRLWLTNSGRALRVPVEAERRALESKVTSDLNEAERKHLMSALTKIHRAACAALRGDASEA